MSIYMSIYMSTYICFNKYVNIYMSCTAANFFVSLHCSLFWENILVQTKIDVRLRGLFMLGEEEKVAPPPDFNMRSLNACSRRGKSSPPHRRSIEEEKDRKGQKRKSCPTPRLSMRGLFHAEEEEKVAAPHRRSIEKESDRKG